LGKFGAREEDGAYRDDSDDLLGNRILNSRRILGRARLIVEYEGNDLVSVYATVGILESDPSKKTGASDFSGVRTSLMDP